MVKNVFNKTRKLVPVALVLVGWGCFISGLLTSDAATRCILLAAARVLP